MREWIEIEELNSSNSAGKLFFDLDSFTVMCYNTLCDKYATPGTYGYTPSWALNWDYRKELILRELLDYRADVICLQV